ncbi:MAG: phosphotransferase [Candidatus Bathyarchaeia archaeon]
MNFKKVNPSTLANYLSYCHSKGYFDSIPQKATSIKIHNLINLRGGMNNLYAFSVAFCYKRKPMLVRLVLKLYKEKINAKREYLTLKTLKCNGFPVPHVYVLETDEKLFGGPFIIMEKIEGKNIKDYIKYLGTKEILKFFEQFAETLASLHKLDVRNFTFLEQPRDEYAYAMKQTLKEEMWAKDMVKDQDFNWIIRWLESNATKCACYRYSLLHGDMNANNFLINNKGKIVFLDWAWAEIGDPLMDLGYVYYHLILDLFGEKNGGKIFSHFLRHYLRKSGLNGNQFLLQFYMVSAGLREAIFLKYQTKKILNPFYCAKIFGARYLPALPFIFWRYRSKFKKVQRSLKYIAADYEADMFGTVGGKILSTIEINDVLRFLKPSSPKLILDVGTGSGRVAREILKKSSDIEIVGVDISKPNIQSAKVRASPQILRRYYVVIADGQHLPFRENAFDGVICIRTLKYFKNYDQAISEICRVLRTGQVFVLDLSSPLGYEVVLRYITPSLSARGSQVFNFYKMRNIFELHKLGIVDFVPLQKIPHKIWELSENLTFLRLLIIAENILRKITPMLFSRSILVRCVKKE